MIMLADNVIRLNWEDSLLYHSTLSLLCVILCNQTIDICNMCECMSFPRGSNKVILTYLLTYLLRPLFFYFLVYGFLGRKNGSVGRKKKKKKKSQKYIMSSCIKKNCMDILIKSVFLRKLHHSCCNTVS